MSASLYSMEFYLTVDSQNCTTFNRLAGTLSVTLPYTIDFPGNWSVALCQYGLNNGIFLLDGKLHNHAYIVSRIVLPQMLGDKMHRILAIIPLDFVPEVPDMGYFFREIQNPVYVPVDSCNANSITLEMKDSKLLSLTLRGRTEVLFQLHFKQILPSTKPLSDM